jgi:hypothetical protein
MDSEIQRWLITTINQPDGHCDDNIGRIFDAWQEEGENCVGKQDIHANFRISKASSKISTGVSLKKFIY